MRYALIICNIQTNKQELQQTAFNHSSNIKFKDFINLSKLCTAELFRY